MSCHLQAEWCSAENNVMENWWILLRGRETQISPPPCEISCQCSHSYLCNGLARVESVLCVCECFLGFVRVCVCVCVSALLEGHKQCAAVLWHKVYCWLHYIRYFRLLSSHLFLSHRWTVWMWIAQKTSSLHQDWLRWATWAAISAAALDPSPNTSVPFVGTELQVQLQGCLGVAFCFGLELNARYISISSEVQYGCVCREALWRLQLWRLQRLL